MIHAVGGFVFLAVGCLAATVWAATDDDRLADVVLASFVISNIWFATA
jgi:hypothetical protein